MSIDFIRPEVDELRPRISVIGVGGAGGNAIANMIASEVQGVDFIVANTDAQALNASPADQRIQLGLRITQGLGAGSRPEIGKAAAEEAWPNREGLEAAYVLPRRRHGRRHRHRRGAVIAKIAREKGVLTVGVSPSVQLRRQSPRPLGRRGHRGASAACRHLIVITNQICSASPTHTTFRDASRWPRSAAAGSARDHRPESCTAQPRFADVRR